MNKCLSICLFFYPQPASLIDYLPDTGIVILDEISRIQETADQLEKEEAEWYIALLEEGAIVQDLAFFLMISQSFCSSGIAAFFYI
ncbi:hypothetical protein GCM10020331_018830 [Ectobacillus funiculus]